MAPLPTPQEIELNEMLSAFRDTSAPAAAWLAYRFAMDHDLPVPEIVSAEIARFVAEVTNPLLAAWNGDRKAKLRAKDITTAWGCRRGKDQSEPLKIARRDVNIYLSFWDRVRGGDPRTTALTMLADDFRLSRSAVEKIVDRFRVEDGGVDPAILYRDE